MDILDGEFLVIQDNQKNLTTKARLAQLVERQPFKLVVVGSSPTVGEFYATEEADKQNTPANVHNKASGV